MSHEFTLWFVGAWFAIALFLGQAVATCLFGAGLVGVYLWAGPRVLHGLVGQDIFFTASTWSGEPRVVEPEKSAGLRWCALDGLDALPDPVVPHELAVLESLRRGTTSPYSTFGFDAATRTAEAPEEGRSR